jgi:hypothetical protein
MAQNQSIKQLHRIRNRLISAIGLVALLLAALQAWSLSASTRGRLAARFDLWQGHYAVLAYGLEPPERSEYARLLRERYGIELRTVAGDIVTRTFVSYADAYNEISVAASKRKFGNNVFNECYEAALAAKSRIEEEGDVEFPLSGSIAFTNVGIPVVGMKVECFTPEWKNLVGTTATDTSGHFSFAMLPEGEYLLKVSEHDVMTVRAALNVTKKSAHRLQLITEAIDCEAGPDNSGVSRQEYFDSCP